MPEIRTRNNKTIGMNRIGRIRNQNGITDTGSSKREMRQPLFGAQSNNRLGLGIQCDVVARLIPIGHGTPQSRNTLGLGVAVRIASINRFSQLVDNVLRCRLIGVTHPKINDVFTPGTRGLLQFPNDIEDIGR